jgi:hypothetical protein
LHGGPIAAAPQSYRMWPGAWPHVADCGRIQGFFGF